MSPTAKSFILDLLSTLRRGTMPVGALVESAALFGIAQNSLRVALTRLTHEGRLERDARGRYRLSAAAGPVAERVRSWREIERNLLRWNGRWIGVLEAPRSSGTGRTQRSQRQRALELAGFRALTAALAIRPDNLRGGVERVRSDLRELGLPTGDVVLCLSDLDPATEQQARGCWDGARLRAAQRALRVSVERSRTRLGRQPVEDAMVESFLLGGAVIRQLVLDPKLPDEIVCGDERRALLESMRSYDRLGRRAWASFLQRFDIPHLGAPIDTRMVAETRATAR